MTDAPGPCCARLARHAHLGRRAHLARLGAAALTLVLAACSGSAPDTSSAGSSSASTDASVSSSPSASPTPTPTQDPNAIVPGTNHNPAAAAYTYSAAEVHDWLHGAKTASPTYPTKKIAFLTFDDGPTNSTPKVLAELERLNVPASFYVIAGPKGLGRPESPAYLQQAVAQGNSICIHSYGHDYKQLYPGRRADPAAIVADHDQAVQAVRGVLGPTFTAHCMRYPGGHGWKGTDASDAALAARGIYWLDWNADNADGGGKDPGSGQGRAAKVLADLKDSPNVAVILMHDYHDNPATIDSIAPMVEGLRAQGYEFGVLD